MFNGKYEYDHDRCDRLIDEKGNQFIAMRYARWKEENDFKLEIRKFALSEDGETPLKGISFMTEDGPNELALALLEEGYGNPDEIANAILEKRLDIGARVYDGVSKNTKLMERVTEELENIDDSEELYDPKELLA